MAKWIWRLLNQFWRQKLHKNFQFRNETKRNERAKRLNVTAKRGASTGPLAADIGYSYHCNYIETMGKAFLEPQAGEQGARGEGGAGWQA